MECHPAHHDSTITSLQQAADAVFGSDAEMQLQGARFLRKSISVEEAPPIEQVQAIAGLTKRSVELARSSTNPAIKLELGWLLSNEAAGTGEVCKHVVEHGVIQLLHDFLRSNNVELRAQAAHGLGNIAGNSLQLRDKVLQMGTLPLLLDFCKSKDTDLFPPAKKRDGVWAVHCLTRGKPQPPLHLVIHALPVLAKLLHSSDAEVVADACWSLSYLSDDRSYTHERIQAVLNAGVARQLVTLMTSNKLSIVTPALKAVGHLCLGDDAYTQRVLECGVLVVVPDLLLTALRPIRKDTLWMLSSIAVGNAEHTRALITAPRVLELVIHALGDEDMELVKEAAWVVCNSCQSSDSSSMALLVRAGAISGLCKLLEPSTPEPLLFVALDALGYVLAMGSSGASRNAYTILVEDCSGLAKLKQLHQHEEAQVNQTALKLVQRYFAAEEEQ